jgi:hypothetical protein
MLTLREHVEQLESIYGAWFDSLDRDSLDEEALALVEKIDQERKNVRLCVEYYGDEPIGLELDEELTAEEARLIDRTIGEVTGHFAFDH